MEYGTIFQAFREFLRRRGGAAVVFAVAAIALLCASSTKKNTPLSRNWQAFTTRYNVYYNGDEHYKEQLKEMELNYEDDYTRTRADASRRGTRRREAATADGRLQAHHREDAEGDPAPQHQEEAQEKNNTPKEKAFRAREEFNPFLHNAWLTMGRSQFLNGDFAGAAATFYYISRHFTAPESRDGGAPVAGAKLLRARLALRGRKRPPRRKGEKTSPQKPEKTLQHHDGRLARALREMGSRPCRT